MIRFFNLRTHLKSGDVSHLSLKKNQNGYLKIYQNAKNTYSQAAMAKWLRYLEIEVWSPDRITLVYVHFSDLGQFGENFPFENFRFEKNFTKVFQSLKFTQKLHIKFCMKIIHFHTLGKSMLMKSDLSRFFAKLNPLVCSFRFSGQKIDLLFLSLIFEKII